MGREESKHRKSSKKRKHRTSERADRRKADERIHKDDFFHKAVEFRVWLHEKRGQYVEDLSTEEAMRLFVDKFVKRWNDGRLDRMYYEGLPEHILERTKRTRHQWGFMARLNDTERLELASTKDSVGVLTKKTSLLQSAPGRRPTEGDRAPAPLRSHDKRRETDGDDRRRSGRADERKERKRRRAHEAELLEEFAPKETGREAVIERKRQRADQIHGAARAREATADGLDLDEGFLMGDSGSGSTSDLQRRLARRQEARERKDQERHSRVAALQARESERMDKFLADMGLASADAAPIHIAPRR